MERITVQLVGPLMDREAFSAYVQATGEFTVVEGGAVVRLLLSDRQEWLDKLHEGGTLDCSHVVLLTDGDPERIRPAVSCGIEAIVGRDEPGEALFEGIRYAARGARHTSPTVTAVVTKTICRLLNPDEHPERGRSSCAAGFPTEREREIGVLAAAGWSNEEIAARLYVGLPTIKSHLHRLYRKLAIRRRSELARSLRREPGGAEAIESAAQDRERQPDPRRK